MEIVTSRISVYEIELDLRNWKYQSSSDVPDFASKLLKILPTLKNHKCFEGQPGGFISEVERGTNFAHIIEHVILELLYLSDENRHTYKGWTRKKNDNVYVIHYSASDFLRGRLAAILGVDAVKKLISDESVNIENYIDLLRYPIKYFLNKDNFETLFPDLPEPAQIVPDFEASLDEMISHQRKPELSESQALNIISILNRIKNHFGFIIEIWRQSFFAYAGNFGKEIYDKISIINIDKFFDIIQQQKFQEFFKGLQNLSQILRSYRIPINFIVRSIWIYKNTLLTYMIEEYQDDRNFLQKAIADFETFYQMIFSCIISGYHQSTGAGLTLESTELKQIKELQTQKGNVLIVDDDEIVQNVTQEILLRQGFQPLTASSGERALEIITRKGTNISLVIIDLYMPGMDGMEVYKRIKQIRPEMKILITSGYPIDKKLKQTFAKEKVEFISKPFSLKNFVKTVNRILQKSDEIQY